VAARLGHADPTTTMRTYAHAVAARVAAIAQTLAEALDG
jgi:integrase